jgi:hypothetical protein
MSISVIKDSVAGGFRENIKQRADPQTTQAKPERITSRAGFPRVGITVSLSSVRTGGDDQLFQSGVEQALADGEFEIAIASSGEQAVPHCKSQIRALLTDIGPGRGKIDGQAVTRHVREKSQTRPLSP